MSSTSKLLPPRVECGSMLLIMIHHLQLIRTDDQMNILIRSLLLNQQQKAESTAKGAGGREGSRKRSSRNRVGRADRASERAADGRASSKRASSMYHMSNRLINLTWIKISWPKLFFLFYCLSKHLMHIM